MMLDGKQYVRPAVFSVLKEGRHITSIIPERTDVVQLDNLWKDMPKDGIAY